MARALKSLLCLLLVIVMLVGCSHPTADAPAGSKTPSLEDRLAAYAELGTGTDDNYRTWYELFIYSFCDSDGDGIGDLQGVISKLDYLEELGVNGIWFMPIHPSTSYHKYNVDDYYAIDPDYGTMADFEQLMEECEKRDIKVILDLVVNHSGNQNPWFTAAVEYLQNLGLGEFGYEDECKYFGYYNFVTEVTGMGYNRVPGTPYYYECQFSSDMPDLKLENEELRKDIKDIMQFWMDKGVAGFRVDAAKEFYTGNDTANAEFMNWLQTTANSIKPDAYMVAEAWFNGYGTISKYYESQMVSIFNYPFGNYDGKLVKVINGRGNSAMVTTWATALETADKSYSKSNPNYIDAPFLSNHDVGRIYSFVGGDEYKMKMAGAMNLFMSGSAFVYYGEEIGMAGTKNDNDPTKRAPMNWSAEDKTGMTNPPPGCTTPTNTFPALDEQRKDESSIYNYYREAIAIRNAYPVISHGKTTAETALNKECISAMRKTWDDKECIILMNINDEADTCDLSEYADWNVVATLSANGEAVELDGTTLNMAAYGIAVLIPAN